MTIINGVGMILFDSPEPVRWGELDLPIFGLWKDWHGAEISPAAGFALAQDDERLWFFASRAKAAAPHPDARPGKFLSRLWEHDVAELFLADPVSGRYLEFNLAPNGAWWNAEFTAPRVRTDGANVAMPGVQTFAEQATDGSWVAALSLPLDVLQARIGYGLQTRANVTFILDSPDQRFLTATDLGGGEPDFHRPDRFAPLKPTAIPVF
jgi:hypothetical protein